MQWAHVPVYSARKRTDLIELVERQRDHWISDKFGIYNHSKTTKATLVAALEDPASQFTKSVEVDYSEVEDGCDTDGKSEDEGASSVRGTHERQDPEPDSSQLQVRRISLNEVPAL